MPDFASFTPFVTPVVIGLIVVRVLVQLAGAYRRQGNERRLAVSRAWANYFSLMILALFVLPLAGSLLGMRLSSGLVWPWLIIGGVLGSVHQSTFKGSQRSARTGRVQVPAPAKATRATPAAKPTPSSPVLPVSATDLVREAVDPTERIIGKLPMPLTRKVQSNPLPSEVAENWYARQDARLGQALTGKELAAARLRLSTVKSMLLLGQLGVSEADDDVNMVLRQAGRGR